MMFNDVVTKGVLARFTRSVVDVGGLDLISQSLQTETVTKASTASTSPHALSHRLQLTSNFLPSLPLGSEESAPVQTASRILGC